MSKFFKIAKIEARSEEGVKLTSAVQKSMKDLLLKRAGDLALPTHTPASTGNLKLEIDPNDPSKYIMHIPAPMSFVPQIEYKMAKEPTYKVENLAELVRSGVVSKEEAKIIIQEEKAKHKLTPQERFEDIQRMVSSAGLISPSKALELLGLPEEGSEPTIQPQQRAFLPGQEVPKTKNTALAIQAGERAHRAFWCAPEDSKNHPISHQPKPAIHTPTFEVGQVVLYRDNRHHTPAKLREGVILKINGYTATVEWLDTQTESDISLGALEPTTHTVQEAAIEASKMLLGRVPSPYLATEKNIHAFVLRYLDDTNFASVHPIQEAIVSIDKPGSLLLAVKVDQNYLKHLVEVTSLHIHNYGLENLADIGARELAKRLESSLIQNVLPAGVALRKCTVHVTRKNCVIKTIDVKLP